jgi:hypothetical protein
VKLGSFTQESARAGTQTEHRGRALIRRARRAWVKRGGLGAGRMEAFYAASDGETAHGLLKDALLAWKV